MYKHIKVFSKYTFLTALLKGVMPVSTYHYACFPCSLSTSMWKESISIRRDWKYQRGNQNLYIEEEQTTHWPKEKQQSTKHTHKTKDRVTRTPLKTGGELRCSGSIGSSCSTSGTHRVNLVTNYTNFYIANK
jgi:hypothetical protein